MKPAPHLPIPATIDPATRVTAVRFAASLSGSPDSVYAAIVRKNHINEVRTVAAWKSLVDTYRGKTVARPKTSRVIRVRTRAR
jgi:hypothetical protein